MEKRSVSGSLLQIAGVKITVGYQPKTDQISKIAACFLVWSNIFQIKEGLVYTLVLTCVVGVADISTLFCCWETNKPGGAIVHHSVNKHFEVNTNGGRLADWHVRSIIGFVRSLLKSYFHP